MPPPTVLTQPKATEPPRKDPAAPTQGPTGYTSFPWKEPPKPLKPPRRNSGHFLFGGGAVVYHPPQQEKKTSDTKQASVGKVQLSGRQQKIYQQRWARG